MLLVFNMFSRQESLLVLVIHIFSIIQNHSFKALKIIISKNFVTFDNSHAGTFSVHVHMMVCGCIIGSYPRAVV